MAFTSGVEGLVVLTSWSGAHAYYEKRDKQMRDKTRIRNRYEGVPLQRSKHDAWGRKKLIRHDDNSYSAVLYDTSVVRWYADGDITLDTSYESLSTYKFADHYLPSGVDTLGAKCVGVRMLARGKNGEESLSGHVYHEGTVTFRFNSLEPSIEFLDNTTPHVRRVSKRGGVNNLTKPVIDYISMLYKLSEDAFDAVETPYSSLSLADDLWGQVKDGGEFDPETAVRYASRFAAERWGRNDGVYGYFKKFDKAAAVRVLNAAGYEDLGCYKFKPIAFGERAPSDWVPESEAE